MRISFSRSLYYLVVLFGFVSTFSWIMKGVSSSSVSSKIQAKLSRGGKRIAVVTCLHEGKNAYDKPTEDDKWKADAFIDSAASLAISSQVLSSKYDIELVAIVQPRPWLLKFKAKLAKFGFRVLEADIPVIWKDIPNNFYKGHVNSSGCCGMNELVKLNVLLLKEYDRIIVCDMDHFFIKSFDHLFDLGPEVKFIYTGIKM